MSNCATICHKMSQQQEEEEVNLNDLPLPPPPSPTQLKQYEELCGPTTNNNSNSINISNNNSIPGNHNHIPPQPNPQHSQYPVSYHARTLSSLSSMSSGSNTTHSSTHSLSPTPYNQMQSQQQILPPGSDVATHESTSSIVLNLDQYGTISPMHSRQTSSSSCGLVSGGGENINMTMAMPPTPPPPPPPSAPMPTMTKDNITQKDMYIKNNQSNNTNVKLMTKQNENDMNSYNKAASAAAAAAAAAAASGGGLGNQKAYNKFLKEYSNKLITQQNTGGNNSNKTQNFSDNNKEHNSNNNNISNIINNINTNRPSQQHNPNINSNSIVKPFPLKQTFKTPLQQQQIQNHQQQKHSLSNISNNNNTNNNNNSNGLTNVAALTATLNNQLKFDSCQVAPTPCSNIPIVDKSLINSSNNNSSSNINISNSNSNSNINYNNNNSNSNINTTSTLIDNKTTFTNDTTATATTTAIATNMMASVPLNGVDGTTTTTTIGGGDKPFEYVTLTGNVIRSVVPPGKGATPNYKVNQGYVRPFGAAPPSAAPKSPVSFPPQPQQWNAPPPTQPKPVGGANPYATLPRTNAGPQDRSGPVTMAFQALDEHVLRDQSQTPTRPYTPSRPAPIVPSYQTPEKLCFDECEATHARAYDRCSASPFPDRARSPAPGPPPNPLAAIRAPRMRENEMSAMGARGVQAGSITTGQSYLGVQQAQQQGRMMSHAETSSQSGMQRYTQEPERREEYKMGNMSVQRMEQSSRMEEQQQSQSQSQTTTQVGNTQIERRRKVTEEFEHTSSAKTVEIRTGSQSTQSTSSASASNERRLSYGKGFVANQARRLSGLEQEISNLTPQSQAISARAANLTDTKFPEFHTNMAGETKFPTKPLLPHHDEPKAASYVVSGASCRSMASLQQQHEQRQQSASSAMYGTSMVSQQQQMQQQQQKSLTSSYSSMSSSQQQQQQQVQLQQQQQQQHQVNTVSSSLTQASATTLTNNQNQYQAYNKSITAGTNQSTTTAPSQSAVCPVTGTFCRPGHTCCKQQNFNLMNNNNRPNASLGSGPASNIAASSQQPQQQQQQYQQQAFKQAVTAPAPTPASTNISSVPSNLGDSGDSAGGVAPKGGAFGATSAPKRGRGIMNKAVGPGVRVPLCNSCGTQIRGPFITALGKIWCPEHFHCVNANCRRPLQDIGFVEEKGDLYCEYCFEKYLAPSCSKCSGKIKGDCLNAIGKHFHPECFSCGHCGKLFGNTPFFLEDGMPYCEADWNELFTTKCFACGFPVEAGDRWVEALNHNYHSQCFNCTYCKQNLEGQSFYNKGGRPFCKNHAR